jgi:transcriptional regulator with XRE-family HTH domain
MTAADRARPRSGRATADRDQRRAQAVDLEVARRVRRRRLELGLTQQQVAERLGVAYQQLHKYEAGLNRVSAGLLHRIAQELGVEVGHFFADMDVEGRGRAEPVEGTRSQRRRLLDLVRNVASIRDRGHREALCRLARDLAALGASGPADPQVEQPSPPPEPQPGPNR